MRRFLIRNVFTVHVQRVIRATEWRPTVLTISAAMCRFRFGFILTPLLFGRRQCSCQGGGLPHANNWLASSLAPDISISRIDLRIRFCVLSSWFKGGASPNQRTKRQVILLATAQPLNSLLPLLQADIFHQVQQRGLPAQMREKSGPLSWQCEFEATIHTCENSASAQGLCGAPAGRCELCGSRVYDKLDGHALPHEGRNLGRRRRGISALRTFRVLPGILNRSSGSPKNFAGPA